MIEKPKGTNDFLYPESKIRETIISKITQIFEKFGYKPIETPIFEYVDLFKRSAGITSDIVSKEMYEFVDKKGRNLALRPEITAPVVRAILQNNLTNQNLIKLYYFGYIFRYEKPQKDRYRQATQFGVEYFGQEEYLADFEIIYLTYLLYKSTFNLDVQIHINSIGCKQCRPTYREKIYQYFSNFQDKLCKDCQKRLNENPLRILDCKNPTCKEISSQAPKSTDYLCNDCKKHFSKLLQSLEKQNLPVIQNPLLVRGLDYYNRTVFEVKIESVDLAGGGRYDYLVSQLSNNKYNIPAVGFAGGLERLTNILKEKNKLSLEENIKINLISLTEQADEMILNFYVKLIQKITKEKLPVEILLTKFSNLSKALKTADQTKVDYSIFVGEEELQNEELTLKIMKTGKQEKMKIENFFSTLYNFIQSSL
ncbi:MAG: histidine--tRNA ligase [bacterium]